MYLWKQNNHFCSNYSFRFDFVHEIIEFIGFTVNSDSGNSSRSLWCSFLCDMNVFCISNGIFIIIFFLRYPKHLIGFLVYSPFVAKTFSNFENYKPAFRAIKIRVPTNRFSLKVVVLLCLKLAREDAQNLLCLRTERSHIFCDHAVRYVKQLKTSKKASINCQYAVRFTQYKQIYRKVRELLQRFKKEENYPFQMCGESKPK